MIEPSRFLTHEPALAGTARCGARRFSLMACAALAAATAGSALAARPHEHGIARLDVAVAPGSLTLDLSIPLDSLLGHERAPRSAAEIERASVAVARLRAGEALFRIDASAGCALESVELTSAPLELGAAVPAREGHADLEGRYAFRCRPGALAGAVEVGLFDAFAALRRIELQVATPKGQLKATLLRPVSRVRLAR